jgi:hypothetical protein
MSRGRDCPSVPEIRGILPIQGCAEPPDKNLLALLAAVRMEVLTLRYGSDLAGRSRNMIKQFAVGAGALLAVAVLFSSARAQNYASLGGKHSLGSPTVSPYLNLQTADQFGIVGGYQTLVKPFFEARKASNANSNAISRLQNQVGSIGGGGGGGGSGAGPAANHFMNFSHYYTGVR